MDNSKIVEKIQGLKTRRKAIFLVHNYQIGEVQDIADYTGDSLGLSKIASQTDAEVIVFCGVQFMAETASILCPGKKVLMPDRDSGCPMADMITADQLRLLRKKHPGAQVLSYVNTSAEVKAESDICCTSANAIKVVESLEDVEEIIFIPDKYLSHYVSTKTNRSFITWNGYCPSHVIILPEDILEQKKAHPRALVLVHPECTPPVVRLADEVLSTEGMCKYIKASNVSEIIVGTEVGLLYRLRKENPEKKFYPASEKAVCPTMKLTTLEKVLWSLEDMKYEVKVKEEVRLKAKRAVDRMLEKV
jgi:quinolinate synthase